MGLRIKQFNTISKGENVMKKMNNKGFSLVELIVVVLIMAIIAVALAPQVMKWVENSRKSTDAQNYDSIVSAANIALSNEYNYKYLKNATSDVIWEATTTGGNYAPTGDGKTSDTGARTMEEVMGDTLGSSWKTDIKVKAAKLDNIAPNGAIGSGSYKITMVHEACSVVKTLAPYNPNS